MEGQHSSKATSQAAQLILKCLSIDPKDRPSMKEVMEVLVQIQAMTFMKKVPEELEQIKVMEEKPKKSKFSSPRCSVAPPRHRQPRRFLTSLKASCQYVMTCPDTSSDGLQHGKPHHVNFSFYFKIGACRYGDRCSRLAVSTPNPASAPPFCSPTSTNVNIHQHFQVHLTIKKMLATPHLKEFTFKELKMATRNFSAELGDGSLWKVYKGWMDEKTLAPSKTGDSMLVAIKEFNPNWEQHFETWQAEVNILGRHYHPNLIGLLGYCWEDEKLLLVNEFMHKGSLDTHLFRRNSDIKPLSWDIRLKIAIGAARGLAFLHTLEKKVIYRDFKTYNIMLDENYNAKLSNLGLATLGPSSEEASVSTMEGQYSFEAALQAAQLSLRCLELDPRSRPSMKEVMEVLREIEALSSHLHE
ncbi:hypothetical protein Q3G72_008042 [Acer saccharum]|nr:hypothetical protein Q3G72_008042 [Acer saccharum]